MDTILINLEIETECLPLRLQWVHPGQFKMGNNFQVEPEMKDEAQGKFEIILSQGYWLGVYPITQCQWRSVMDTNPSPFQGVNKPVTNISWENAIDFCNQLNSRLIPKPANYVFSLPTEAQWEYACKAGTEYKYQLGDTLEDLSQVAWHRDNAAGQEIQDVGQKSPNNWGFHDMLGNISEFCFDGTGYYPDSSAHVDWVGDVLGSFRTTRGGDVYINPSKAITCSLRGEIENTEPYMLTGFRLCLRPQLESEQEDE